MRNFLTTFVPIAVYGASAIASPVEQANAKGSGSSLKKAFSINQIAVYPKTPRTFAEVRAKTYLKYGLDLPPTVEAALKYAEAENAAMPPDGGQTSVPIKGAKGEAEFLLNVRVGTHNLSLDPDTGSGDLWVISTLLPQNLRGNRPTGRVYDTSKGKEVAGSSWQIKYGDRSTAGGKVYRDKVTIGDLSVNDQAVEAAAQVSATFSRDPLNDGLLGLSMSGLNQIRPAKQKTWFDNIRPTLKEPVFAVALKRRAPGTFDFGYIDRKKYTGDIHWVPIGGKRGFWDISATGIQVGGGPVKTGNINAIVDTGSSLWYMPKTLVDAYYAQVPGAKFGGIQSAYTFPCNVKLPDIGVVIAGKTITVPGINMNYQQAGPQTCFGGLQPDKGMPFSIFGDVFLKNLYVVFEHKLNGQPRVGFAQTPK